MKHFAITITILAFISLLKAQNNDKPVLNGTVIYEQTVKLDIKLEGDAAEFSSMIPKERKSEKILYFNEAASLYENINSEDTDEMTDEGSENIMIKIAEPEYKLYTDFENNSQIEQKEFMTRYFLIENELDTKGWKLTGNQKNILNYTCQEAIKLKDSTEIRAWFTPEISVSAGPGKINGLPGLVLAAEIDEGQRSFIASKFNSAPVDKSMMIKPKKGKKVSEEEFRAIVEEKMKEMGADGNGEGPHMIMEIKIEK